jgi:DNA-binding IclR family transcriptional regulator
MRLQTVSRAIEVLLIVAREHEPVSAKSVRDSLGLSAPTTHHLLQTLAETGMLAKDSRRRYSLGPTIGMLADSFGRQLRPPDYLQDPVRRLAEVTGEVAYVSSWRSDDVVVLASFAGDNAVRVSGLHKGYSGCGHARASAKALLAYIDEDERDAYFRTRPLVALTPNTITDYDELKRELARVRNNGFAEDNEEFCEGVSCLSVPVMGLVGVIAAFTVSVPAMRYSDKREEYLALARAAADQASAAARPGEAVHPARRVVRSLRDAAEKKAVT